MMAARDIKVRYGNQTGCGGLAIARVDVEPAAENAVVDAVSEVDDRELVDMCVASLAEGVAEELRARQLPPVRVVVRWVLAHPVDSNEYVYREVGRRVVRAAVPPTP
jgi:hypothetical protein